MGTHYSHFQDKRGFKWARQIAAKLLLKYPESHSFNLVYTGMSGISGATLIMSHILNKKPTYKFGMLYVRKIGEDSHGSPIERGFEPNTDAVNIFVDDFISSGASFFRAWHCVSERGFTNWGGDDMFDLSKCYHLCQREDEFTLVMRKVGMDAIDPDGLRKYKENHANDRADHDFRASMSIYGANALSCEGVSYRDLTVTYPSVSIDSDNRVATLTYHFSIPQKEETNDDKKNG